MPTAPALRFVTAPIYPARMRSLALAVLCLLTLAAGCNRQSDAERPTSARSTTSATTAPSTTTTSAPTGPAIIQITGLDAELRSAVQNVYDRSAGAGDPAALPQRLSNAIEGAEPASGMLTATSTTAVALDDEVAVVRAGDDVILLVDEGRGWQVVGFKLPSLGVPATYGDPVRHVFVVGSDARPGEDAAGARADSLHIVAANAAAGTGAIVGIPRDGWVQPPSGRSRKFTEVLAVSGPEALLATARTTTGLEIEGYILTGFAGFVALVDEFGTVEIDIPMNMADRASGAYFTAGLQEIDGSDALAFARNRTIAGGDFTRQLHGGVLIGWIGRAVQDLGVEAAPELLNLLTSHTVTDLSAADLLTLTASLYELDLDEVPNVVVPGRIGTAGSASVVFLEEGAAAVFADLDDGALQTEEPTEP